MRFNKESRIFLAGHNGMVGSSVYNFLKKKIIKIYLLYLKKI